MSKIKADTPVTTAMVYQEPGPRDVLLGRGQTVYTHLGNRRYRKIIDKFVIEWAIAPKSGPEKLNIMHEVIRILSASGYRFLKKTDENNPKLFFLSSKKEILEKIRHSFQDQLSHLPQIQKRNQKEKSRIQLLKENLSVVDYAEYLVDMEQDMKYLGQLDAQEYDIIAEETRIDLDSKVEACAPDGIPGSTCSQEGPLEVSRREKTKKTSPDELENCVKFVDDLVKNTITSNALPIEGDWKFYPRQELENIVDLGTDHTGWQLHLRPILHDADPITFDVPL